jgi:hypothetical protein
VGAGLLGLGVLGALDSLDRIDMLGALRTWWPSILVVWGCGELYDTAVARSRRGPS